MVSNDQYTAQAALPFSSNITGQKRHSWTWPDNLHGSCSCGGRVRIFRSAQLAAHCRSPRRGTHLYKFGTFGEWTTKPGSCGDAESWGKQPPAEWSTS